MGTFFGLENVVIVVVVGLVVNGSGSGEGGAAMHPRPTTNGLQVQV